MFIAMLEHLVIYHSLSPSEALSEIGGKDLVHWRTCLRSIALGFSYSDSECLPSHNFSEKYHGVDAYRFLMEVICGLHSPVSGETEIMGQFKSLLDESSKSLKTPQRKIFSQLLADAKMVRQKYLLGGGSRSYGSLLRKYLKGSSQITILGAGHLTKEILPWLKSRTTINIICRDVQKAKNNLRGFSGQIAILAESTMAETLVIAASISTDELRHLVKGQKEIKKIIDLRDVSSRDPLHLGIPVVTLEQLFSDIDVCEREMQLKVAQAKEMIAELSQKYFRAAELRPFGWEDLCG